MIHGELESGAYDALDRVRLASWEATDPGQLRYPCTAAHIPFAAELFAVLT